MNAKNFSTRAFTLIEIMVTISIIAVLTTMSVVRFRSAQKNDTVRRAAQQLADELRIAQNSAQSGKILTPSGVVPPSYGIHIDKVASNAKSFADTGLPLANVYDASDTTLKTITLPTGISIDKITIDGSAVNTVDIVYKTPTASGLIDNRDDEANVVVILKNGSGQAKTVTVNRVTGRIDAQY